MAALGPRLVTFSNAEPTVTAHVLGRAWLAEVIEHHLSIDPSTLPELTWGARRRQRREMLRY